MQTVERLNKRFKEYPKSDTTKYFEVEECTGELVGLLVRQQSRWILQRLGPVDDKTCIGRVRLDIWEVI